MTPGTDGNGSAPCSKQLETSVHGTPGNAAGIYVYLILYIYIYIYVYIYIYIYIYIYVYIYMYI